MIEVLVGDCVESMRRMSAQSVHTCVTSPPYFGLRDYGMAGQIGLEDTPDAFVARLVEVFREVRRVLRDDGTLWLNLGDSYVGATSQHKDGGSQGHNSVIAKKTMGGIPSTGRGNRNRALYESGLAMKQLIGIPWRVAFALQADGWYLRQDIIWHKPNPMPESVTDRCTKAHEYVFMLSKSARYFFDANAIKEPAVCAPSARTKVVDEGERKALRTDIESRHRSAIAGGQTLQSNPDGTRNRRSVWTVATKPYAGAHFATFPPDLIEPCILAGSPVRRCTACGAPHQRVTSRGAEQLEADASDLDRFGTGEAGVHRKIGGQYQKWLDANPKQTVGWNPGCDCNAGVMGGTVLDPFGGSGTTAGVSAKHGRRSVVCELNPDYAKLVPARVEAISGMAWDAVQAIGRLV